MENQSKIKKAERNKSTFKNKLMALSANLDTKRKDGDIVSYPVKGSATIYKGAMVVDLGTGYASAGVDTAGAVFLGVAVEKSDNSSSATDGAKDVRLYKTGTFVFSKSSAVQDDIARPMYISDDQTVATSTTNMILAGPCVDVPDSSHVRVRIDDGVDSFKTASVVVSFSPSISPSVSPSVSTSISPSVSPS